VLTLDNTLQEVTDIAPGLWLWQVQYIDWPRGDGWDGKVVSTCVESGGEIVLLDPVAPAHEGSKLWTRLDARPPTLILVLKPDHVRNVDFFVGRYGVRAFGPEFYNRDDIPETELEPILPGNTLPGGLVALYDGRGRNETPIWIPEHRTIVFADALTAPEGDLLVWWTPWHQERALPALRALLELPFERVIVSHGKPVHDRKAYERALELLPWKGSSLLC
jgi:glyoxylase-like metal-dependent hydrolase (beta-lactamase superfamily II)